MSSSFSFPPFNHFLIFITENGSEQIFQKGNGMSEKVTTLKNASGRTRTQAIICKDIVACTIFENSCFFAFSNFQWHIRVRVTGRMLEIYGETFLLLPGKPDQYAISGRQSGWHLYKSGVHKWFAFHMCTNPQVDFRCVLVAFLVHIPISLETSQSRESLGVSYANC